jgi:hypothetical protein
MALNQQPHVRIVACRIFLASIYKYPKSGGLSLTNLRTKAVSIEAADRLIAKSLRIRMDQTWLSPLQPKLFHLVKRPMQTVMSMELLHGWEPRLQTLQIKPARTSTLASKLSTTISFSH